MSTLHPFLQHVAVQLRTESLIALPLNRPVLQDAALSLFPR